MACAGGNPGLAFAGSCYQACSVAGSCSMELRPNSRGSPLTLQNEKNSPYSARAKNHQRQTTHPHWYTKSQPPNRAQLAGPGQTPTTARKCDSARREREPRKSRKTLHLGQIQHAYRSLTSCCAEKANLTGAAAARKGRKKGSRSLGESRLPSTNKTKHEFPTDCWSKR